MFLFLFYLYQICFVFQHIYIMINCMQGKIFFWSFLWFGGLSVLFTISCKNGDDSKHFQYFRNYSRTFNDMNDKHLEGARQWGIRPLTSPQDLKRMRGKMKEIKTCRLYKVDNLTHSHPYLVPRAVLLLQKIGLNFRDSLSSKGLPAYRVIVTSVLRTGESVEKLRYKNINASANSAHLFGTTFDIAYSRFKKNSFRETETDKLKSVLAEVLRDLRNRKQCYVRYEYKQGCFHITVR